MKNILIATTFEADTLQALKIAADLKRNNEGNIILLSTSEVSDSITDMLFLSAKDHIDQHKRKKLFDEWAEFKKQNSITVPVVEEHHQFGISRPVLLQLLERFKTEMVIVPASFQNSKQFINKLLLKLLNKSEFPLMLLPEERPMAEGIQRALFLGQNEKTLAPAIQNLPFHIIHQSMIEDKEELSLEMMVEKLKINLIVQPKQNGEQSSDQAGIVELGLPVLTV